MQQGYSKEVIWDVRCSSPKVMRHCKKCGGKTEYVSSGQFRINAQRKSLDIWLIYKCERCNTTWNNTIYTRISPQQVGTALLERFHSNDENLAMQYAMDIHRLEQNGAEVTMPDFEVSGEPISLTEPVKIRICSQYPLPLKISSIIKKHLGLSGREFDNLFLDGRIKGETAQDIRKCKLLQPFTVSIMTRSE